MSYIQAKERLRPAIAAMCPIDFIVFLFSRHDLKLLLLTQWATSAGRDSFNFRQLFETKTESSGSSMIEQLSTVLLRELL